MSVLVIGAGRSGTSALTGALEALGLFVGPPAGLVPPSPQNPEGFFELQGVAALNEELLIHLGGGWDSPPDLPEGWLADVEVEAFIQRAQELVVSMFGKRQFVLKDPRIALLLPFWRRVLLDRCCAVMVVRDPTAVAWSLSLSFGWPHIASLALWSAYNRSALKDLSGLPVHVCSYDDLIQAPVEVLSALVDSLRHWGEIPEDANFDAAVARINPGLRRDTWPRNQAGLLTPPAEFVSLATTLMEKRGRHDSFDPGELPEVGPWQNGLLEERRVGSLRLRASREMQASLHKENASLAKESESLRADVQNLRTECDDLRTDSAALRARLLERQVSCDALLGELETLRSEVDIARKKLEALLQSKTFRYTALLRTIYTAVRREIGER